MSYTSDLNQLCKYSLGRNAYQNYKLAPLAPGPQAIFFSVVMPPCTKGRLKDQIYLGTLVVIMRGDGATMTVLEAREQRQM